MFNPFDTRYWQVGSQLAWWDSTFADIPSWMPKSEAESRQYLLDHRKATWNLIRLLLSFRTATADQLHQLVSILPSSAHAKLYMAAARCRLIDLGFPLNINGITVVTPYRADFTAFRLPTHRRMESEVARLGLNPAQLAALGPFPLRGARQYDRHNLIATHIGVAGLQRGWRVTGEAWGRFDILSNTPGAGGGGPDLQLFDRTRILCIELTASTTSVDEKIEAWSRKLLLPHMQRAQVLWLCAGFDDSIQTIMTRKVGDNHPRMFVADAQDFAQTFSANDGTVFTAQPYETDPDDWMHTNFARLGERFGLDDMGQWSIPQGFRDLTDCERKPDK